MRRHNLRLDGMVNIPIYLVWECCQLSQLHSILFTDHITFNNGYMKRAHTRHRMTNNNDNNKKKTSLKPPTIPVCFQPLF